MTQSAGLFVHKSFNKIPFNLYNVLSFSFYPLYYKGSIMKEKQKCYSPPLEEPTVISSTPSPSSTNSNSSSSTPDSPKETQEPPKFRFQNYNHSSPNYSHTIPIHGYLQDISCAIEEIIKRPSPPRVLNVGPLMKVCPCSLVPISCPGRGVDCRHNQCFDLREFLILSSENGWRCPICGQILDYDSLRFDHSYFSPHYYFPSLSPNEALRNKTGKINPVFLPDHIPTMPQNIHVPYPENYSALRSDRYF